MKIKKDYISNQNTYAENDPENIVIHNTDNFRKGADAEAHAKAQHDGNLSGMSAHVYVDDKEAEQAAPYKRGAWHVGVNYGGKLFGTVNNRNSIAIEMCVNEGYNYEKAFQNTVAVCKQLMEEFGIPADRVYSHYDVCAKNCPSQIRAKGDWERFKSLIGGGQDIKDIRIGDSTVNEISKVVYNEAGVIQKYDALVAVAQCIKDMTDNGGYGKGITDVMERNFSAYGQAATTDDARRAVYEVFKEGKRRFADAVILQFRSFTKYSDGSGNMDPDKCAALLAKYEYLGKDARNNQWGHLYFGHKAAAPAPEPTKSSYVVQAGSFSDSRNANKLADRIKAAGFDAIVKGEAGQYKVQCGVFEVKANADALVASLKAAGFEAIIKTV